MVLRRSKLLKGIQSKLGPSNNNEKCAVEKGEELTSIFFQSELRRVTALTVDASETLDNSTIKSEGVVGVVLSVND